MDRSLGFQLKQCQRSFVHDLPRFANDHDALNMNLRKSIKWFVKFLYIDMCISLFVTNRRASYIAQTLNDQSTKRYAAYLPKKKQKKQKSTEFPPLYAMTRNMIIPKSQHHHSNHENRPNS